MKKHLLKIWVILKSKRTALVLICVLFLAVSAEVLLDVKIGRPLQDTVQPGVISRSPLFVILSLLILCSLTACTLDRTMHRLKYSRKGSVGRWGSTMFHVGLMIVIVGSLVSTRCLVVSRTTLLQNEKKLVPYQIVKSKPLFGRRDTGLGFYLTLQKQEREQDYRSVQKEYSLVTLSEGDKVITERRLALKDKLVYHGIYMFPDQTGYTVVLTIYDPSRGEPVRVTAPLSTNYLSGGIVSYTLDSYRPAGFPDQLAVIFYPDAVQTGEKTYVNKSYTLGHPALAVAVKTSDGHKVDQVLRLGEKLNTGKYHLAFTEIKPWTSMYFVYDPGAKVVLIGAFVALFGISWFYLLTPRKKGISDDRN